MFAELLNGVINLHNTRMRVDLDDCNSRLMQPPMRIGVIPAGVYAVFSVVSPSPTASRKLVDAAQSSGSLSTAFVDA